ncbi:MAG: SUMF1/EgtB/PvdO family nonheme iron enzyme [bacterium]|nr:SUMF1/EgtB/PvdO family nonheme iron enzyme [bacterium]
MRILVFYLILVLTVFAAPISRAEQHALLIGINKYPKIKANLDNAINDVNSLKKTLKEIGFEGANIRVAPNLKTKEFEDSFNDFLTRLKNIQKDSVALFFFSGHGLEYEGENYLVPGDITRYQDPRGYGRNSIRLSHLLRQMQSVQIELKNNNKNLTAIFIVDACRENPLNKTKKTRGFIPEGGLAAVIPPNGIFIMYSAGAGQLALDGLDNDPPHIKNSVYTRNLLDLLRKTKSDENLGLGWLAQEVRSKVYELAQKEAKHLQSPAYYDQFVYRRNILGKLIDKKSKDQQMAALQKELTVRSVSNSGVHIGRQFKDCAACPEMMALPGGTFKMGSPASEKGRSKDEGNMRDVTVKRFAISQMEISNKLWNLCVADKNGACKGHRNENEFPPNNPVHGVSWHDANDYISWLSLRSEKTYRFLTEAEWEYAARARSTSSYSYGDDPAQLCKYGNGADQSLLSLLYSNKQCSDQFGRRAAPVGIYRPNNFNLYGMIGNVWEWVEDCYVSHYKGAPSDGLAHTKNIGNTPCERVVRSGSWRSTPAALRSAARNHFPAKHSRKTIGIRVARVLDDITPVISQPVATTESSSTIASISPPHTMPKSAENAPAGTNDVVPDTPKTKHDEETIIAPTQPPTPIKEPATPTVKPPETSKPVIAIEKPSPPAESGKPEINAETKPVKAEEKPPIDVTALVPAPVTTPAVAPAKKYAPLFNRQQLLSFSRKAKPELIDGLLNNQKLFYDANITTPLRIAHFFSTMAIETGGLKRLDENMSYSAQGLRRTFGKRVSPQMAKKLHRKKKLIANYVYGSRKDLGNRGGNDGWNYRGSGYIQLTGRYNFRERGKTVKLPFEAEPTMVRKVYGGLIAATAFWTAKKINRAADRKGRDSVRRVRKLVNGGKNGLPEVRRWFKIAKKVFVPKPRSFLETEEDRKQEAQDVSDMLNARGFTKQKSRALGLADTLEDRLKRYQKERNIPETGIFDLDTLYAVSDSREWRHREVE